MESTTSALIRGFRCTLLELWVRQMRVMLRPPSGNRRSKLYSESGPLVPLLANPGQLTNDRPRRNIKFLCDLIVPVAFELTLRDQL